MAAGSAAVLTSFLTNLYICLGCFGAFSVLRLRPWARRFFAARRYAKDIDLKPKRLPNGLLNWIVPVVMYPEADIIDEAGLDCAMYLRILRFGVIQFFVLTIFCIIVVLPPNLSSGAINKLLALQAAGKGENFTINGNDYSFTNFDRYSLSNVEAGSKKMWAHLIAVYFVVLFTLWLLWRFNKESVLLRLLYLGNGKRGGPSHTVLVTDIPGVAQAVAKGLREERSRKLELERSRSRLMSANSKDVEIQVDTSYMELASGPQQQPPPPPAEPPIAATRKTKSVTIVEPPSVQKPALAMELSKGPASAQVAPTQITAKAANGQPSTTMSDADVKRMVSPFAMVTATSVPPADTAADAPAFAANPRESGTPTKSGLSLKNIFGEGAKSSSSNYTLFVEVDPKYASTGGKLEPERKGKSNEVILDELAYIEPEDPLKGLPPSYGVDTRPLPPDRRNTRRFEYDMKNNLLDPEAEAKKKLKAGITPQQMVAREFAMIFAPINVAAVNMIQDTRALEPLVAEYDKIAQQLEDYLEMAKLRLKLRKKVPQKQLTILRVMYGKWDYLSQFPGKYFAKVDAVEFWLARLQYLRERIKEEQANCIRKSAASAFVTFNTRIAQAMCANSLMCHNEKSWRVQNAPAPFELVWRNLSLTFTIKNGRLYILWAAFWAMTLFFMIPVGAIQAMIEIPKLAKVPVLGDIVTAPAVKQILQAILPGLVLKIFLILVPTILRIMATLSGATSISEIDFGVVKRFFVFQVIVVFFGSIIAGSFFNQLQQWVKDPQSVIQTLGKSIPMTSTFFITYLLVNGLGAKSIAFIRLPNFIIFWLLSKFAGSPRARMRLWMYQITNNGTTVVDHTIAILLGVTFSCINPIMCPVALAYFVVNYVGEKYNNIYVFRREYESAGRLWQTVYNQVMTCLYIMQITMFGLMLIKKFAFAFFIIPLIVFSIACHLSTLQLFSRPWSVTALHDAAKMDLIEADERRMNLLAQAREERKKKRDKARRAYNEAARKAEAEGEEAPAWDPKIDEPGPPGKSEKLLMEALEGDGFVMNSEEKKEIAEIYLNPVFKVQLDDVDRLTKLAAEVQSRVPRLNAWVKEYRHYRREVQKYKLRGDPDLPPPPKMPEDLTIFDEDPNLVDSDDEDSVATGSTVEAAAIRGGGAAPKSEVAKRTGAQVKGGGDGQV